MVSINTNPATFAALRNLNLINTQLTTTQNRVSTGLRVNSALDDASSFSIAQGIRGELKAISAVSQGLNNSKGIGKVALAGATGVSDILTDIRSKLTELSNEGLTNAQRDILSADFEKLVEQAQNFVDNASFNGVNLLRDNSDDVETLSNLDGSTLTLTAQDLESAIEDLADVNINDADDAVDALDDEFADLEETVNSALGSLGSEVRAFELQTDFLSQIRDATEEGLGNIVDADIARESARLSALQVQQQLAVQSLGIANAAPQFLLGLFR